MIKFPNAKINLGLHITAKRTDGYHDLETIFVPIPLFDALEFIPSDQLTFTSSGLQVPGSGQDNLVMKAYHLLKHDYPQLPPLDIYLHKRIPFGAGLGGGSSNASFMLMMLNKHFQLHITKDKILHYAALLGSDCPFFIHNIPCYAEGRGEVLTPIPLDLSGLTLVLIKPDIHVNTAWAFSQIKPAKRGIHLKEMIQQPMTSWKDTLNNDFEEPIFKAHPELDVIKRNLYAIGAQYASMSGSGSSIFGLFNDTPELNTVLKGYEHFYLAIN